MIVRTAAEGASEDELARDVKRLQAQWEDIQAKAAEGGAPVAALRGARPGHPGRPGPVQRGLPRAGHPGRRRRTTRSSRTSPHVSPDLVAAAAPVHRHRRRLRRVAHRRADPQGPGPQGLPALRRSPGDRPHRGDDRRRRQHRQVHRRRRQPRGDGHPQQPGGGRGDRPPAAAARPRRHRRHRLHRHGAGVATASWCCAGSPSAWAGTGPSTRSPRSPRSAWCR